MLCGIIWRMSRVVFFQLYEFWGLSMGDEMGNSNTVDLREEEPIADLQLGKSSPGSRHQDDEVIGSELVSMGKGDDLSEKNESPVNTDVCDTMSGEVEQPAASPEISTETGQDADDEKQQAIPSNTSADDENLMDDEVRVETDDQLASTDLSTKEPETFMDGTADLKEPVERLKDVSHVSDSMDSRYEQHIRFLCDVSANSVPDAIREAIQNAEEVDLKEPAERLSDVSHVSDSMDSGDEQHTGFLGDVSADSVPDAIREAVQNAEEVDLKEPAERLSDVSHVSDSMDSGDEQHTGFLGDVSADSVPDAIREAVQNAEEVELESNEVLHLEGNRVEKVTVSPTMEFLDGDRGKATETEATESGRDEPRSQAEEDDTDGQNDSSNEFKETAGGDELNDQPQCDEVLGFVCTSTDEDDTDETSGRDEPNHQPRCDEQCIGLENAINDETILTDVCPFESANGKQCHLEVELLTGNGFHVDVPTEPSESVEMDSTHEEKEPLENIIILEGKETTEASNLVGDDNCDGLGAADQFITTSPAAKQFDGEGSQTSDSSNSTTLQSSGAVTVSDFEFEELSVDLPETPGASLGFVSDVKVVENGGGDHFPETKTSGSVNGKQHEEEAIGRLSSRSNSDSIISNIMQKSPSFDLDIQPESDQIPMLFQDKAEITTPTPQDKSVMLERSDSHESKTPLLGSPTPEGKEEQAPDIGAAMPPKQENRNGTEKAITRGKERRSLRHSFFGMCMGCGTDQQKKYGV